MTETRKPARCWSAAVCLAVCVFTACVDAHVTEAPLPLDQELLHRIRFDHNTIVMAVGDTVRLHTTAYSIGNDTIPIPEQAVTWRSTNSALTVDSTGRLVARTRVTSLIRVIGSWTLNNVARTDTANVRIVAARTDVAYIKVTPVDSGKKGFSEKVPVDFGRYDIRTWNNQNQPISTITVDARLVGGTRLPSLVGLTSLGNGMYGVFAPTYVGDLWVRARALIFGQVYQDSAKFTGLYPVYFSITMTLVPETGAIIHSHNRTLLQPCGTVQFVNKSNSQIRIVFSTETAGIPCGGTVPASGPLVIAPGQSAERVMSAIGTIPWRGQLAATNTDIPHLSGVLTVKDVP